MTRPIYEPNPQRQGASLEFGQQQLYRRPAPVAQATAACFPWIRLSLYSRSVSNLTWTEVPFRFLDYDPACVTEDVDYSWTEINAGLAHNIWRVESLKEGFYFYDCEVRVEQPGTAATDDGVVRLRLTDGTNVLDELYASADWFRPATFPSGNDGEIPGSNGVVRLSGIVYATANLTWKPQVQHTVGGSRAIEGNHFYLVKLMDTDATAWTELTTA